MSRRTGVQWMHSIVCIYNDTHQKVARHAKIKSASAGRRSLV